MECANQNRTGGEGKEGATPPPTPLKKGVLGTLVASLLGVRVTWKTRSKKGGSK